PRHQAHAPRSDPARRGGGPGERVMTAELVSQTGFEWFVTAVTGGVAGAWLVYDAISLYRVRRADGRDPLVRARRFGYLMGIVIGIVGIVGCLRFHDVM